MTRGSYIYEFTFELGGCVTLDCEARITFGEVDEVKAYFQGRKFDLEGLVIDYDNEFLPLREWLTRFAKTHKKEK